MSQGRPTGGGSEARAITPLPPDPSPTIRIQARDSFHNIFAWALVSEADALRIASDWALSGLTVEVIPWEM